MSPADIPPEARFPRSPEGPGDTSPWTADQPPAPLYGGPPAALYGGPPPEPPRPAGLLARLRRLLRMR